MSALGVSDTFIDMVLLPDGKFVVLSQAFNSTVVLSRFNADGSLATSFGTGGKSTATVSDTYFTDLALQADGRLVVGGSYSGRATSYFVIARFSANGTAETGYFSPSSIWDVGTGPYDTLYGIAIAPDGKIVATGQTVINNHVDTVVTRLNTTGGFDTSFSGDGKQQTAVASPADDVGNAVTVQSDKKVVGWPGRMRTSSCSWATSCTSPHPPISTRPPTPMATASTMWR